MASQVAHYSPSEKRQFSRVLRQLMMDQGLNGAELARKASQYREGDMPRQLISTWLKGGTVPDQINLMALAKALKVPPTRLLPKPQHLPNGEIEAAFSEPTRVVNYSWVGDKMQLNIRADVSVEIGHKVLNLLRKVGH